MYTHQEILDLQKRIVLLEEECEFYSEFGHQMSNLAIEMVNDLPFADREAWREKYHAIHRAERGPSSAEALLEFARTKQFKTEPEEELGVTFNVVMIEWLEEWVECIKDEETVGTIEF